uniref:Uncharacterized protein n=1 Tax=Romanomermis culicivorax TaxID=13658 RepID=A0A915L8P0_ROMCU
MTVTSNLTKRKFAIRMVTFHRLHSVPLEKASTIGGEFAAHIAVKIVGNPKRHGVYKIGDQIRMVIPTPMLTSGGSFVAK